MTNAENLAFTLLKLLGVDPARKLTTPGEKNTTVFYFQVIHPDAFSGGNFAQGRSQMENLKAVIDDVLGHGNDASMLPGQIEAGFRKRSDAAGGILFTAAEVGEFNEIAAELGQPGWQIANLARA